MTLATLMTHHQIVTLAPYFRCHSGVFENYCTLSRTKMKILFPALDIFFHFFLLRSKSLKLCNHQNDNGTVKVECT